MESKEVLFAGTKQSFIVRVLIKKVEEAGIACEFVPSTVDDISRKWNNGQLLVLFLEDARPKEDLMHYLVDFMVEKNNMIILIGEQPDIDYVSGHISQQGLIYSTFARPVDNEKFIKTIKEYYEKADAGELKKSILIVDDDPQYLSLVRQWLKDSYKVTMANSGLQAIKFLGKNKVDLILLDHEMPVTSGPQVLEMLRSDEETKSIPVMFLTGKSDKESVMAVVALRPEGYFLKSIQKDELLEKLQEFFVLHRLS